ncbi:MAG TPA: alpha/beta fold hydrolase [Pseudonocardia sp.]|nr:alpha/beta fold hydrolase [Pseudonocardia sp.]
MSEPSVDTAPAPAGRASAPEGTRVVTVRGVSVRVRETGRPDRPTVLALHGIGRSLEDWAPQHDRLADRRRVLSMDLPGFGFSDRLPGPITLPALADGVLATLDALGETGPVHVLGNSLGGAVALQVLARQPDRVRTLVLVNSAGFGKEVTIALRLLAVPGLGRRLLRGDRRAARRAEESLFVDRSFVTDERLDLAVALANRPQTSAVFLEAARELGSFRGVRAGWRAELLDAITAHPRPTLLLWGDRDLILPAQHLRVARQLLPHAQSHVFGETGHMPQVERADRFAELVGAFLDRSDPPG